MLEEFAAINKHKVYKEYNKPAEPQQVIGSHWVFKIKRGSNGSIIRYKARVVARGDHQREGIDFPNTYAPIARMSHVRLVLVVVASRGWDT